MKALLAVALLAISAPVFATTNLAIVCTSGCVEGQPVPTTPATFQVYKTPTADDLVRVDPNRTIDSVGGDWNNVTTYVWKKVRNLAALELHEVCKSDVSDPHTMGATPGDCTQWGWIARANIIASGRQPEFSWMNPTQYTDGSNIAAGTVIVNKLRRSDCSGAPVVIYTGPSPVRVPRQPLGTFCYNVTATVATFESDPSTTMQVKISGPAAPTDVRIEAPTDVSIEH